MGSARRKRRMQALWRQQNGICFWCPVEMIHWNDRDNDPAKQTPEMQKLWATLDHLRPRGTTRRATSRRSMANSVGFSPAGNATTSAIGKLSWRSRLRNAGSLRAHIRRT